MVFLDKTLLCRDCGREFVFSSSEQEFFAEKGFTNNPARCVSCRKARKKDVDAGSTGQQAGEKIICAACGREAIVPFKPKNNRPVYCRECFIKQR